MSEGKLAIQEGSWMAAESITAHSRRYHTRLRLLEDGWQVQSGQKGTQFLADGVTPINSVLSFALSMRGVTAAQVQAYDLVVMKSPVFTWAEIDEQLLPLLHGIRSALSFDRDLSPEELLAAVQPPPSENLDPTSDPELHDASSGAASGGSMVA